MILLVAALLLAARSSYAADGATATCGAAINYVKINLCAGDMCLAKAAGAALQQVTQTSALSDCRDQCSSSSFCIGFTWTTDGYCGFMVPTRNKPYNFIVNSTCATYVRSDLSYSAGSFYGGYTLVSTGKVVVGVAMTASECILAANLTAGASAISYRPSNGECAYSVCGNLEIVKDTDSIVYLLSAPLLEGDSVPQARHEWMLTDACGFESTGKAKEQELTMKQFSLNFNTAPTNLFGNAVEFKGTATSYLTVTSTVGSLVYGTKMCASFFTYVYNSVNAPFLAFFVAGSRDLHIWRYPDTNTFWVNYYGLYGDNAWVDGHGAAYSTGTPVAVNAWRHETICIDSGAGKIMFFEDGRLQKTTQWNVASAFQRWNQLYVAKDPGAAGWSGRMYCLKLFDRLLTEAEVASVRQSCLQGRIRVKRHSSAQ